MNNVKLWWWLDGDSPKNLTPNEDKPTFKLCDVYEEYLKLAYNVKDAVELIKAWAKV